jgi:CheY-like chemotaxis protein
MPRQAGAAMTDAPSRTVLLVAANPALRKWIHVQIEKSGYNLLEAENGADALLIAELYTDNIDDVIVADALMPWFRGAKLLDSLQKLRPGLRLLRLSRSPKLYVEDNLPICDEYMTATENAARRLHSERAGAGWHWLRLVPTFAAVALVGIGVVALRLPRRATAAPFAVSLRATRGAETQAQAPSRRPLALKPDLVGLAPSPSYRIEVVDTLGNSVWKGISVNNSAAASITMPPQKRGTYFVRVALPSGETLREYGLEIRGTN